MTRLNGQSGRIKIILPVVLLVLIAGGWYAWQYFSVRESTDDAQVDGHIHPVNAKVGGTVAQVLVKENQLVEAGAVLVQLDDRDFKLAVAKAEADLADAHLAWLDAASNLAKRRQREQFDFLCVRNHAGHQLNFHALRHTCGAWLALAGNHPQVIQAVLRHSSITLTMDTYGHLFPS